VSVQLMCGELSVLCDFQVLMSCSNAELGNVLLCESDDVVALSWGPKSCAGRCRGSPASCGEA
jgi:hypothetical protein